VEIKNDKGWGWGEGGKREGKKEIEREKGEKE